MNTWELRTIKDEETIRNTISETMKKTYSVAELLVRPFLLNDDKNMIEACKRRILELRTENGEWVTPNPHKYDWKTEYQWNDGISWKAVDNVLPVKYRDEGAYGLHEWLVEIGAVAKDYPQDHEYGMVDYKHKTKAQVTAFAKRINKKLTELRSKKLI